MLPHARGEEGEDGDQVGDEPEHSKAGQEYAFAPELKLLPNLKIYLFGLSDLKICLSKSGMKINF